MQTYTEIEMVKRWCGATVSADLFAKCHHIQWLCIRIEARIEINQKKNSKNGATSERIIVLLVTTVKSKYVQNIERIYISSEFRRRWFVALKMMMLVFLLFCYQCVSIVLILILHSSFSHVSFNIFTFCIVSIYRLLRK